MIGLTRFAGLTVAVVLGWSGQGLADDLAKASQNPVGDLISVPFDFSFYGGLPVPASISPSSGPREPNTSPCRPRESALSDPRLLPGRKLNVR
jgi:hypothetical protein